MIRYQLTCADGHEFEGWFASSSAFDEQIAQHLVACAVCGQTNVKKQISAPAVSTGRGEREHLANMIGKLRDHIAATHRDVGEDFAREARAMHYGEKPREAIYGATTPEEAAALKEEGIDAAPLPEALVPLKSRKGVQ